MANDEYKFEAEDEGVDIRTKINAFIEKGKLVDDTVTSVQELRLLNTANTGDVNKSLVYVCSTEAELKLVIADNSVAIKIALLTVPIELTGTFSIYGGTRILGNEIRIVEDIIVTANTSISCGIYIEGSLVLNGDRTITFNNASSGMLRIYCIGLDSASINSNASINLDGTDLSIVWYQNLYDRVTINNSNVNKNDWLYPSGNKNRQFRNIGNGNTLTSAIPIGSMLVGLVCYPSSPTADFGVIRLKYGTTNITQKTFASGIQAYVFTAHGLIVTESNVDGSGDIHAVPAILNDIDLVLELTIPGVTFTIKTIYKSLN